MCTDIPLSVGILDPRASPTQLNAVEFLWDPSKRASAFIQVSGRELALGGEAGALGSIGSFLETILPGGPDGLLPSAAGKEAGRVDGCGSESQDSGRCSILCGFCLSVCKLFTK